MRVAGKWISPDADGSLTAGDYETITRNEFRFSRGDLRRKRERGLCPRDRRITFQSRRDAESFNRRGVAVNEPPTFACAGWNGRSASSSGRRGLVTREIYSFQEEFPRRNFVTSHRSVIYGAYSRSFVRSDGFREATFATGCALACASMCDPVLFEMRVLIHGCPDERRKITRWWRRRRSLRSRRLVGERESDREREREREQ